MVYGDLLSTPIHWIHPVFVILLTMYNYAKEDTSRNLVVWKTTFIFICHAYPQGQILVAV